MLTPEENKALLMALHVWADSVPDVPALGFIHSRYESEGTEPGLMTPRQVLAEVLERSRDGVAVLQALELGVRRSGLSEVVSILTRRASTPRNSPRNGPSR